jgi:ABC-type sugar transport system permease subunit
MTWPAFLLFLAFVLLPLVFSVGFSFTSWNGLGKADWVGFDNFTAFFQDDRARNAVLNSPPFRRLFRAPSQFPRARLRASTRQKQYHQQNRQSYCLCACRDLAFDHGLRLALDLKDNYGVLYSLFALFGNGDAYVNLLGDKTWAMAVIIVVNAFQYVGLTMTIYSAGLQDIPSELYESGLG